MESSVALYFNGALTNKWSWQALLNGDIGLSGTDSQALWLSYQLSKNLGNRFTFFTNTTLSPQPEMQQVLVDNLSAAIEMAAAAKIAILICNAKTDEETFAGLFSARSKNVSLIVWCQNDPNKLLEKELTVNSAIRRVIMVSRQQYFSNVHRGFVAKMVVINNALYSSHFSDPVVKRKTMVPGSPVIGFMGATNEYKGFHWVCKAWPLIKEQFPGAQLWVMGSVHLHSKNKQPGLTGVSEKSFEDQYLFPNLGNTQEAWQSLGVYFLGNMGAKQLQEKVMQCDLGIVNPNITGSIETFCVSALDFQALAVPVAGGNAGGLRETILHKQTGWLVSNPDKLADDIIKLLRKSDALQQMGIHAKKWVYTKFDKEKLLAEWHHLFLKIKNKETENLLWPGAMETDAKRMLKLSAGWFRKIFSQYN